MDKEIREVYGKKYEVKDKPNYYLIITPGVYDDHEFNILDTDKGLYVMFKDYYEKDPQSFNDIQDEIKKQYLNTKIVGSNLGPKFYIEDEPAKYGI